VAKCDPNEAIPRPCAEFFRSVEGRLATIEATARGIHEQTMKTNGHVATLFQTASVHGRRLQSLEESRKHTRQSRHTVGSRVWGIVKSAIIAALAAGLAAWWT